MSQNLLILTLSHRTYKVTNSHGLSFPIDLRNKRISNISATKGLVVIGFRSTCIIVAGLLSIVACCSHVDLILWLVWINSPI